jgi:hypothetical protein
MKAPGQVFYFCMNSNYSFWVKLKEKVATLQTNCTSNEKVAVRLSAFLSVILMVSLNDEFEAFI